MVLALRLLVLVRLLLLVLTLLVTWVLEMVLLLTPPTSHLLRPRVAHVDPAHAHVGPPPSNANLPTNAHRTPPTSSLDSRCRPHAPPRPCLHSPTICHGTEMGEWPTKNNVGGASVNRMRTLRLLFRRETSQAHPSRNAQTHGS
jgi:hypothetical protein